MKKDFSREFWALIGTGLILCAFLIGWNFFSTADVTVFVVTEETSAGTIAEEIGAHPTQLESGTPAEKININTASAEDLDFLPGIGAVLAERIVDYREEHGGFRSLEEIKEVSGIGDATYEEIRDLITLE